MNKSEKDEPPNQKLIDEYKETLEHPLPSILEVLELTLVDLEEIENLTRVSKYVLATNQRVLLDALIGMGKFLYKTELEIIELRQKIQYLGEVVDEIQNEDGEKDDVNRAYI